MKSLTLIGAGGHGKVVADTATAFGYQDVIFLDDTYPKRKTNSVWPIAGKISSLRGDQDAVFISIGHNAGRENLFQKLQLKNSPTLVHPAAIISPHSKIGAGSVVIAGAIVNADTKIGRGVILNTGCSVDHDCELGDFVHISPGAHIAGGVRVGARSWIGIGAVIKEGVRIGSDVVIAAGAAVIADVENGKRMGGVPARDI